MQSEKPLFDAVVMSCPGRKTPQSSGLEGSGKEGDDSSTARIFRFGNALHTSGADLFYSITGLLFTQVPVKKYWVARGVAIYPRYLR